MNDNRTHNTHTQKAQHKSEVMFYEDSATKEELSELVAEMHLRGINIRYLLRIYCHLTDTHLKRLILTEAVARTIKHLLEEK
jgi:hypothetical protein